MNWTCELRPHVKSLAISRKAGVAGGKLPFRLTRGVGQLDVSPSAFHSGTREEDSMHPAKEPSRFSANLCYAVAICTVAVAGWFLHKASRREEAPATVVTGAPSVVPSIDDQLRAARETAAPSATRVIALPPIHRTPAPPKVALKPGQKAESVRGGITIVGPAGTTTAIAPATKSDIAPAPEAPTTLTVLTTASSTPSPGPKLYPAQPPDAAPRSTGKVSEALRFYNYDQRVPDAIQRLNRGEDAARWQKRVSVRPND
jgi:hypothetical protein